MILLSIPKITSGIQIVHLELRLRVLCSVDEVITAARSLWQNPYVERMIGSIRRECLDHLVVLNERKLRRILSEYIAYYNKVRPHQSLDGNPPEPREVEPPATGKIISCRYEHCVAKTKGRWNYLQRPFPEDGSPHWTLFATFFWCQRQKCWRFSSGVRGHSLVNTLILGSIQDRSRATSNPKWQ